MKAINVQEAQPRLRELIAEACQGELIVLTDGEKQVALEPHVPLDLERDTPELETELRLFDDRRRFRRRLAAQLRRGLDPRAGDGRRLRGFVLQLHRPLRLVQRARPMRPTHVICGRRLRASGICMVLWPRLALDRSRTQRHWRLRHHANRSRIYREVSAR